MSWSAAAEKGEGKTHLGFTLCSMLFGDGGGMYGDIGHALRLWQGREGGRNAGEGEEVCGCAFGGEVRVHVGGSARRVEEDGV